MIRDFPHPDKTVIEAPHNQGLARSIIGGVPRFGSPHTFRIPCATRLRGSRCSVRQDRRGKRRKCRAIGVPPLFILWL